MVIELIDKARARMQADPGLRERPGNLLFFLRSLF
jgi:hypothetical protein